MIRSVEPRSGERDGRHRQETWLTFPLDLGSPHNGGFGTLKTPSTRIVSHRAAGRGRHRTTMSRLSTTRTRAHLLRRLDGLLRRHPGGRIPADAAGRGIRHNETNASRIDGHVFRLACVAGRRSRFQVRAKAFPAQQSAETDCAWSPRPTRAAGSLRIHQDALIYSAMLDPGQHVVHELSQGRTAWLHLVRGEVDLGDVILTTGDGAGFHSRARGLAHSAEEIGDSASRPRVELPESSKN